MMTCKKSQLSKTYMATSIKVNQNSKGTYGRL